MNERELLGKSTFIFLRLFLGCAKYAELLSHFEYFQSLVHSWNIFTTLANILKVDHPTFLILQTVVRRMASSEGEKWTFQPNILDPQSKKHFQNVICLLFYWQNKNNFTIFNFHKVHMYPYFPSQCCLSVPLLIPRSRLPCVNFSC